MVCSNPVGKKVLLWYGRVVGRKEEEMEGICWILSCTFLNDVALPVTTKEKNMI